MDLLVVVILFLAILTGLSCHPRGGRRDLDELDSELLGKVEQLLAPVPRLSGSSIGTRSPKPREGGGCPPALRRSDLSHLGTKDRLQLARLGRQVARLPRLAGETPRVLRVRALWTLLADPTTAGAERVIRLLEAAFRRDPSVRRRNDLAVAYLLLARGNEQGGARAAALELLDNGVAESDVTPEILTNRTYALQCLTLWHDAEVTWERLPGTPIGRSGAQDESAPLTTQAPARSPRTGDGRPDPLARRRQAEWLLGEWGTSSVQGEVTKARYLLRAAEAIGVELRARSGDQLVSTAVSAIRRAQDRGDHATLLALQRGHAAFHSVRGSAIYSECRPAALREAETQLAEAGSPFVGWVRLDQAVCAYFGKNFARAETLLTALEGEADGRGEIALQARSQWILGLVRMVQGRFVEADRYYSRAIELFHRLGEEAHAVYLQSLRAKSYEYGGARQEAWRERLAALSRRWVIDDPERRFTMLEEASQALQSQGYPVAALCFLAEQMRAAEAGAAQTGKTDLLAFTLLARAALLLQMGREGAAAADLDAAETAWQQLPSTSESRRRLRVEIDVQRARLAGLPNALAAVDQAIAFFAGPSHSLGDQIQILALYRLRAAIEQKRGDFRGARADLMRGIAEVERERLEMATMEDRARFLAQARVLFLDLIRLDLDRLHDPLEALEILERSSNRVLAEAAVSAAADSSPGLGLSSESLRSRLPAGTIVVRFGHLPDRLLLWTFLDGRMELEQRLLPEAELTRQIESCRGLMAHGSTSAERDAACGLLALNLLPRRLRDAREPPAGRPVPVLVIPDELVAPLSLAALRTTPSAPYLVESFRLSYAPSLSLLLSRGKQSRPREIRPRLAALFVSDPAFDRNLFPSLSRLPAAGRALPSYASHYARVEVLSDRQATVPGVLAALGRVDLLQFDGHGITNAQYPQRGGLLMAPTMPASVPDAPSLLTATDLTPPSLRRLRLVILGACSTGLATYQETAEMTGLAAAFLVRGVPEVVAAAWNVPDESVADFLAGFHQQLAAGKPVDEALRAAQLAMLHSNAPQAESTATWAAFQVLRRGW